MPNLLTFVDIVNAVLDEIDVSPVDATSDAFETDAAEAANTELRRVKRYVQIIYQTIYRRNRDYPWCRLKQTLTTVAGQAEYDLNDLDPATDFNNLYWLQAADGDPVPLERYDTALEAHEGSSIAYVLGSKLIFKTTPLTVETYTLVGKKKFVQLAAHDDEPLMDEADRQVLYFGAAWMAKEHDNENSHYAALYTNAITELDAACDNSYITQSARADNYYY